MSYLVLARKWRPKRFAELVGQEHVVRALTNALDSGRVHHAFLFTGTRGVGKTTIARIFAKSLNCETGTSADPCGTCEVCQAIDAGRFIDLLEIDAASNTGVDDVRELIENAQYMPARGRTKVYLIDEVHMLSKAAFNALLKTLEEPPGHVKFLLATTDPQKLPVTVLSRCLQFNLKRLDEEQISGQMRKILSAEGIAADDGAIAQLSRAADGSLRDGLSLLDQAIAYTGSALDDAAVAAMLGTVDRGRVAALLHALADADGERMLGQVAELAEFSPDWGDVLDALAQSLHSIQVQQLVPSAAQASQSSGLDGLAEALRPDIVQLWYHMALQSARDLQLAPSPRVGFEMAVLRMLAFRPLSDAPAANSPSPTTQAAQRPAPAATRSRPPSPAPSARVASGGAAAARAAMDADAAKERSQRSPGIAPPMPPSAQATPAPARATAQASPEATPIAPVAATPAPAPTQAQDLPPSADTPAPKPAATAPVAPPASATAVQLDTDGWLRLVASMKLVGAVKQLALHSGFVSHQGDVLQLSIAATDEHLKGPALVEMLAYALAEQLGGMPTIRYVLTSDEARGETVHQRHVKAQDARQAAAEQAFINDEQVQRLVQQRGARIIEDSIRPLDE